MNRNLKIILFTSPAGRLVFKPFGYNKLLLAVILMVLKGMAGFWTGLVAGCLLDMQWESEKGSRKKPDLTVSKFMLSAYIVQMSSIAQRISVSDLMNRLSAYFPQAFVEGRMAFFNELLKQRIQVDALCAQINRFDTEEEKNELIRFFIRLSQSADAGSNRSKAIYYVASKLDIDEEVMRSFQKPPETPRTYVRQEVYYYKVLNVPESVTYPELRRAFHTLAKQYHPDANNKGTDEKLLSEKFRQVKEAYEKIKELKGWK